MALDDLNRLLKLVIEQEKKYGTRLSPHSNYYRRHVMVQQFLQSQLSSQPSPTRRILSLMWLEPLGKVVQLRALLFNRKKVGSNYKKFRKEKREKILTRGCTMVI